jgi:hypothetical protein
MTLRRKIICTLLLAVTAVGSALYWRADRGPIYQGRSTADWVAQALRDESPSEAIEAVLKIGAPATPFIARQGLHNKFHRFYYLSADYIAAFSTRHPWLGRWLRLVPWPSYNSCAARHTRARRLLDNLGTNAQAAIPSVIDCLEHCRGLHFTDAQDLIDTLGEISGTNTAAMPYLTRRARRDDSLDLRAAAVAYFITGQTNLLAETCERLARKDPGRLLGGHELFWFREDHELNQHLVPLLEKLYPDPRLTPQDRESVMFELESRGNSATGAIARLLATRTNAPIHAK